MKTKEQIEIALRDAMRSGDEVRKRTLRMAISSIRMVELDKRGELDEAAVIAILQKELKSRNEAIVDARRARREDLIRSTKEEIVVLESFLPQAMSEEELKALTQQVIEETGAGGLNEMGLVMKNLMPRVQGRATGQEVSQMVRRLLQNQ